MIMGVIMNFPSLNDDGRRGDLCETWLQQFRVPTRAREQASS